VDEKFYFLLEMKYQKGFLGEVSVRTWGAQEEEGGYP
jgi:hypothetical protein